MDATETYLVEEALRAAGVDELPADARRYVNRRIAVRGYDSSTHNLGGIRCAYPHRHGDGKRCSVVNGRAIARFRDVRTAAGVLAVAAYRATSSPGSPARDLPMPVEPVGGFKSTHPQAGEIGDAGTSALRILFPPYGIYKYLTDPSEDAERRFRDLAADWESFEKGGVENLAWLAEDVRTWRAFRDAWRDGDADVKALAARENDANRVRQELFDKSQDPAFHQSGRLRGGDIEDATPGLVATSAIANVAKETSRTTRDFWRDIPWQFKAAGAGAVALYVLTLVREIVRAVRS